MADWNDSVIAEFRANHGRVGGNFEGAPLLLLHTTGARTGAERVSPMMYLRDGDRYLVFASYAGRDENPAWFHNLVVHPDAAIEVGDDTITVRATVLDRAERDEKYAEQARLYPGFAEYERKTERVIPVVALTPVA
ncbi:nitroreductase family deazaflavin-dependent oxidoreductase [Angustibacter aerolatus]|nr:nitroreductase family deazaflavin-dependent oxidoreductase [Angustibacter aerolatus]